jgi:lysophospholipase L1-like esterase
VSRFGHCVFAAIWLLLLAAAPAGAGEHLTNRAALRPFFDALRRVELHRTKQPVRILQIGDSHTANDSFSGRLRERFQARFGAAGRGWLPAGIPYNYFRPALVTVSEAGWQHLRPGHAGSGDLFGIDAVMARAETAGANMHLTAEEPAGFERVAVEFVARPGGAPLLLRIDTAPPLRIPTSAPHAAIGRFRRTLPRAAHQIELIASKAGQEVLGWSGERRGAGIIYENHGTIGATAALLSQLDPVAVDFELKERRPALLVIAFGTNEGFRDNLDLRAYAQRFRAAVADLHRAAPGAAILIIGAPDGERLPKGCSRQPAPDCAATAAAAGDCNWSAPRNLGLVRDVQRRIAVSQGWAFWDWSAALGGRCSMSRLFKQDPPMAMPDHVHLSKLGYTASADILFDDLMTEYARRTHRH